MRERPARRSSGRVSPAPRPRSWPRRRPSPARTRRLGRPRSYSDVRMDGISSARTRRGTTRATSRAPPVTESRFVRSTRRFEARAWRCEFAPLARELLIACPSHTSRRERRQLFNQLLDARPGERVPRNRDLVCKHEGPGPGGPGERQKQNTHHRLRPIVRFGGFDVGLHQRPSAQDGRGFAKFMAPP